MKIVLLVPFSPNINIIFEFVNFSLLEIKLEAILCFGHWKVFVPNICLNFLSYGIFATYRKNIFNMLDSNSTCKCQPLNTPCAWCGMMKKNHTINTITSHAISTTSSMSLEYMICTLLLEDEIANELEGNSNKLYTKKVKVPSLN